MINTFFLTYTYKHTPLIVPSFLQHLPTMSSSLRPSPTSSTFSATENDVTLRINPFPSLALEFFSRGVEVIHCRSYANRARNKDDAAGNKGREDGRSPVRWHDIDALYWMTLASDVDWNLILLMGADVEFWTDLNGVKFVSCFQSATEKKVKKSGTIFELESKALNLLGSWKYRFFL